MRYVLQRHFIVNVDETKYLHLFYAFSPVPGFPFPPDILTGNFWDFFNLPTASSPRSIHRCCNAIEGIKNTSLSFSSSYLFLIYSV